MCGIDGFVTKNWPNWLESDTCRPHNQSKFWETQSESTVRSKKLACLDAESASCTTPSSFSVLQFRGAALLGATDVVRPSVHQPQQIVVDHAEAAISHESSFFYDSDHCPPMKSTDLS